MWILEILQESLRMPISFVMFCFFAVCFWRYFLNSVFQYFILTVTYFKRIPSSLFSSLNFPFFIAHVTSYSCNILCFAAGHNENFQKLALLPEGRTVGTVSPFPWVGKAEGPGGGRRETCSRRSPSIGHVSLAFPAVHFFPTVRDSCLSVVFTNKGQLLTHFLLELGELVFIPGAVNCEMVRQVLGCEQVWAAGQHVRWSLCPTEGRTLWAWGSWPVFWV